jgi:N4-gp56 family major capsid protein
MADTVVPSALQLKQWEESFYKDYLQFPDFASVMGTQQNAVIQVKSQLGKRRGDTIYIELVNKLTNSPTTGSAVLEGNEEDMSQRSHAITIDKRRNAVRIAEMEEIRTAIDLRDAGRSLLLDWSKEDTRDLIIESLGSLNGTPFLSRTSTIADAWLVDNKDRTVFGAYASGGSAGGTDMSADLGQLDVSADSFTFARLDDMILRAKLANPKIRPVSDPGNGKRTYIVYAGPDAFRDLRNSIDTEVLAVTSVQAQGMKLFEGGDLFWNGAVVKEVDDIPVYANIGNSSAEVTPVYLCGAQALGIAWGRRWATKTKEFDYGDKYGVAVDGIYGVNKLRFGTGSTDTDDPKDHGVVTGFFATAGAATVASAGEV